MQAQSRRKIFWGVLGLILLGFFIVAFRPQPIAVDLVEVARGDVVVTVSDDAKTSVHDVYTLSAPVSGYLQRISAEVGDVVKISETVLARIEPSNVDFLDPRSEAQAKADIQTAKAARDLSLAEVKEAEAELEFAYGELKRMRELRLSNNVSARDLENAERLYKTRRASLATVQAALQMRRFELDRVEALLMSPSVSKFPDGVCECLKLMSPINGRVLSVLHKSEGVVQAGDPLLEIGDPEQLEIIAELLSSDAVKVKTGQRVIIERWGGEMPLEGRVFLVEPVGFTKVSALGIEEQRVNVVVHFVSPYARWQRLGHGYQLDIAVILDERSETLTVPITALFRDGVRWMVYRYRDGRAEPVEVSLGVTNDSEAEVLAGLEEGDTIVLYPDNRVRPGIRLEARR